MSANTIKAGKAFVLIEAIDNTGPMLKKVASRITRFSSQLRNVGMSMLALGGTGAVPFISAIKSAATFEEELLAMQVALGYTDKQMVSVTKRVRELGESTSWTAQEVAAAGTELARGGFSGNEVEASLKSVLDLARTGRMELAPAAKIMIQSMRVFGIESENASSVADAFAIAAKNGATDIEELAQALSFSGGTAAEMGMSLEEVLATLSGVSKAMLTATKGGTSFNQFVTRLATRADKVKEVLGIDVFDKEGTPKDALRIFKELEVAMRGMTQQQKIMAGEEIFNVRGARQFLAIGRSVEDIDEIMGKMRNGVGQAAKDAAKMESGIFGVVKRIQAAFESLTITVGQAFEEPFKRIEPIVVGFLKDMATFAKENQEVFVQLAAIFGSLIAGGAGLIALSGVVATIGAAFAGISAAASGFAAVIGALGASIPAVVAGFGVVSFWLTVLQSAFQAVATNAELFWNSIKDRVSQFASRVGESFSWIAEMARASFEALSAHSSEVFRDMQKPLIAFFDALMDGVEAALPHLENWATQMLPLIVDGLKTTITIGAEFTKLVLNWASVLSRTFIPVLAKVASLFADVYAGIHRIVGGDAAKSDVFNRMFPPNLEKKVEDVVELTDPPKAKEGMAAAHAADKKAIDDKAEAARKDYLARLEASWDEIATQEILFKEREAQEKRLAEQRKKSLEEISKLQTDLVMAREEEEQERIRKTLNEAKKALAEEDRDNMLRKKREDIIEQKRRREFEREESELAKMRESLLESGIDEFLLEMDEAGLRSAEARDVKAEAPPRRLSLDEITRLDRLAQEKERLTSLRNAASQNYSYSGQAFQRGSMAAAQKILKVKSEDIRNRLLKTIDDKLADLLKSEEKTRKAIAEAGGAVGT